MTLQSRLERLEDKQPPIIMAPEKRRARLGVLFLKGGIDPTEFATPEGFSVVCKHELVRLRAKGVRPA